MPTILIVDDNKKNLQVLGNILHEKKYKVAMAIDGPTAIKLAPKINPDVIVLDIMMPGMDGFEVCKIIKSEKKTKDIPIIFLSAKIDLEDIVMGFKVGGSDYVTKPFKKEELLARVATQIELISGRKKILKQTEELIALNALKDKIFGVVASDIKTALDSFIEVPKLLADPRISLSPEDVEGIMFDLQSKANQTYTLLENVIWWSRLQRNQVKPKLSRVSLVPIIQEVNKQLSEQINLKQITINQQIETTDTLIADRDLLLAAIKNILHNALKFSTEKSIISISFDTESEKSILNITDTGVGISAEVLHKITSAYSYHSEYGTHHEKGNGIGLKVAKELLTLVDATLTIESEENSGTTVSIEFQNELSL